MDVLDVLLAHDAVNPKEVTETSEVNQTSMNPVGDVTDRGV